MSTHNPKPMHYYDYRREWDPRLVDRLMETRPKQTEHSPSFVSILILEERNPDYEDVFEVIGVFKTALVANQMALDLWRNKYSLYMILANADDDWGGSQELDSPNDPDLEDRCLGWHISELGELSLKATEKEGIESCSIYVQRRVVHESHQPRILLDLDKGAPERTLVESYADEEFVYF